MQHSVWTACRWGGAVALLATIAFATTVQAQRLTTAERASIDNVFEPYASIHAPGCAVAATRGGNIIYEHGYGMASIELQMAISPGTVFDLGSVSKQFTAASILMLQLAGKLSLDDDVRKYLPELPNLGHTVTLRHLITHTSGWRDYNDLLVIDGMDERDHTTARDAWDTLRRQRALNFVPGATYRYSNTGFFLLGEVVQRVSGQSLARYAEENIFRPLGMTQTQYLDDTRRIVPGRATAYTPTSDGYQVEMSDWDQVGDGAVQSSVRDLAKWEGNLASWKVGGKALQALMLTHGVLNDGSTIGYTAGLVEVTYRGVRRVAHSGAWAGYRAALLRFPEKQIAVLLTCNRADAPTMSLATRVVEVLLSFEPPIPIATASGERADGLYVSAATGATRTFQTRGDTLFLVAGSTRTPLSASGRGTYTDAIRTLTVSLTGDRAVVTSLGDVADTLQRQTAVSRLQAATLREYTGRYASQEIAIPYEVVARDSTLWLHLPHGDDIPLEPVYTDAFDSGALPTIRFLRDDKGLVTAMSFTGRGIHDLRLTRQP